MKKITKIIAFAAMILLALCLTACGGPNGGETPVQPEQDNREYTVNVTSGITNGTVTVSPTKAAAGTTITIRMVPADHAVLTSYSVINLDDETLKTEQYGFNNNATFVETTFRMPQQNIFVTASFWLWPAPTTVTLGAENSGYTVYKAVGDFNIWEQTRLDSRMAISRTANNLLPTEAEAAEHYFNEYENTVNNDVANFEAQLANYNQATQDYFKPWLDNIKAQNGKYDTQHIDQTLEVIYNGISFFLTDLIKNTPLVPDSIYGPEVDRYVLCYSIETVCNQQYKIGYGFNNNQMQTRNNNKDNKVIRFLKGRSGLSQGDLINDIDDNNCAQVVNTLKQKLLPAYDYLNQAKGTNIDAELAQSAINLADKTQAVTAVRDHLKGDIKNYALDNNMEDAIFHINTQTQENGMEL